MRAVLTFHSIEASRSVLSFDVHLFDALLASLADREIPVCDLDTLLAGDEVEGVSITFDDGMKSVYRNALPVLKAYQAPAHLFLTTGAIGTGLLGKQKPANFSSFEMLDWQEVEALHGAGVRVESHTHSHPDMRVLNPEQIAEECDRADETIASRLGRRPKYFAYPFGYHNGNARACVKARYSACFTTELRFLGANENVSALPRLDAYYLRSSTMIQFMDSYLLRIYLRLRSRMRTLKGSQCLPGNP